MSVMISLSDTKDKPMQKFKEVSERAGSRIAVVLDGKIYNTPAKGQSLNQ